MTATTNADVVIIGGGIAGIATAYYLGQAGVKSTVIERDGVGSHASGFAYGGVGSAGGSGMTGPTLAVAVEGARLHRQLAEALPDQTGVNFEFRERPSISLAFTNDEAEAAKSSVPPEPREGYEVQWVDAGQARAIEPRISPAVLGAVHTLGGADVEPYRLAVALTQAAEDLGATVRHGRVTGLRRNGERLLGVTLEDGEVACRHVVLAMGPWSGEASAWLGVPVPVRPLKGQILRLRVPGPAYRYSIGWQGNYATTKPDGLVWAGSTEEEVGFDESTTEPARDEIMAALLKMLPSIANTQLVRQTACLRPLSSDRLLLLGQVPGWEGVYIATGGGRSGIALGPAMGRITADLITQGSTDIPIDAFDPGRFSS